VGEDKVNDSIVVRGGWESGVGEEGKEGDKEEEEEAGSLGWWCCMMVVKVVMGRC